MGKTIAEYEDNPFGVPLTVDKDEVFSDSETLRIKGIDICWNLEEIYYGYIVLHFS